MREFAETKLTLSAAPEATRLREVFDKRTEVNRGPLDLYAFYAHQERQEALVRFFRRIGLASLKGLKILDIGCGSGGNLRRMVDFGAEPHNCFGIDLFRKSLLGGQAVNPGISLLEGTAEELPFADSQFDLAFQFTVLTSVLDAEARRRIVGEISRVLRPSGHFVWYDFAFSNPKNPNVRGIGLREMTDLLTGFRLNFQIYPGAAGRTTSRANFACALPVVTDVSVFAVPLLLFCTKNLTRGWRCDGFCRVHSYGSKLTSESFTFHAAASAYAGF